MPLFVISYHVRRASGYFFETDQAQLPSNLSLKEGDIITFACETYSANSIPVKPQILRIRQDVTWQTILKEYAQDSKQGSYPPPPPPPS